MCNFCSLETMSSHEAALRDELAIARAEHEWQKRQLTAQLTAYQDEKIKLNDMVDELTSEKNHITDELSSNQKMLKQYQDDNCR